MAGFKEGADLSDGVIYSISYYDEDTGFFEELDRVDAKYDGRLDLLRADLTRFSEKTIKLYLCVDAKKKAEEDWATWKTAKIKVKAK